MLSIGHFLKVSICEPYFKRFSGMRKVPRNSVKITEDFWQRAGFGRTARYCTVFVRILSNAKIKTMQKSMVLIFGG